MKRLSLLCFAVILLTGCRKEHRSRVDIYLLKSFQSSIDTTKTPAVNVITNAILDDIPLVADEDIKFYTRADYTFTLRKNIQAIIQNYKPDKAFAVTVNGQPVYYGRFHPMYLSSVLYGLSTITPLASSNKELKIDFVNLTGSFVGTLDKRNDARIVNALKVTRRLK